MGCLEFGLEGVIPLVKLSVFLPLVFMERVDMPFVSSRLSPAMSC
jgi:hypothetical protein